jgi:predicted nucleic acid-binding protein
MSGWLLDASVLLAAEDSDDPNSVDARRLLAGVEPVATLDLALYETVNVAIAAWSDAAAACRLRELVAAVAEDGGLVRADPALLDAASQLALEHSISVYDAAYVAAARAARIRLVSCDVAHLVSRDLAVLPSQANV